MGFLAKVAMGVTRDVAARTREVTGVEPASRPAGRAGWTCGDRWEQPLQGMGVGKAKLRVAGKRNLTLRCEAGASPSLKHPRRSSATLASTSNPEMHHVTPGGWGPE